MLVADLFGTEMPKGLDDRAADPAGRRHVACGRVLQDDLLTADSDMSSRAVREEDDSGRNLFGQSQQVRGIGAGGLEARGVAF